MSGNDRTGLFEIDDASLRELVSKPVPESEAHKPKAAEYYRGGSNEPVRFIVPGDGTAIYEQPRFPARHVLVLNGADQQLVLTLDSGEVYKIAAGGVAGWPLQNTATVKAQLAGQAGPSASPCVVWLYPTAQENISGNFSAASGGGAVTVANGANVVEGSTGDAAGANTIIGQLKQAVADLAGTLTVSISGTPAVSISGTPSVVADGRGAANATTNQVSVATTVGGTQIAAARATRQSIAIRNHDATNPIYLGFGSAATGSGFLLKAGESITLNDQGNVFGISTGAAVTVSYLEEYS